MPVPAALLDLAHALGSDDLAILAEGNCSIRATGETFWVKASGASMALASEGDFVLMDLAKVSECLDRTLGDDLEVRATLNAARVDTTTPAIPSTEAFMHAWLLGLEGITFVGHTHPHDLLSLLATEGANDIARKRLFPDEIVFCGPESCWVDYVMPGLPLARAIRSAVMEFQSRLGILPATIWLQNHGLIALGSSPGEVISATRMAAKAARVWLGALSTKASLRYLSVDEVDQIYRWPDEHFRKKRIGH